MSVTGIVLTLLVLVWLLWQMQSFVGSVLEALVRFNNPEIDVSDLPDLNVRGKQYIGRKVIVDSAIVNGRGKVRVDDTVWAAQGPDLPTGSSVRITGINGTVLIVEAA